MTEPGTRAGELGLATAAAVVQRVLDLSRSLSDLQVPFLPSGPVLGEVAGPPSGRATVGDATPADPSAQVRRMRADADRLVDLYGAWTRALLDAAMDLAEAGTGATEGGPPATDVLVVGPVDRGGTIEATMWLHVLDGPPAAPAPIHITPLVSHDGATIDPACVTFDPPVADTVALRTSRSVSVVVELPPGCPAGTYHGHVLAKGLPEMALPVRVEVTS